jgi:peptide/nickel transport system substrate-binding protein
MFRRAGTWAKVAAAVVLGGALSVGPAQAGKKDDTLRWATGLAITSGDPYYNSFREAVLIIGQMVWDGLVYRDPDTAEYKPLLAKSWTWTDPVTLEFELRDDVKFHDGRPFSADDVVYTVNYVINPDNKVNNPSNVNWMKSAEKLGPHKVRIVTHKPFPAALEYLSGPVPIMPDKFWDEAGPSRLNVKLVGTGPYRFLKWEPGKEGSFDVNPDYMKGSPKGTPGIKNIHFRIIPDQSVQMAELIAGNIDWIWQLNEDASKKLARVPNIEVLASETMRIFFLQFDVMGRGGKNPLQDKRVREAIAHAIDRESISKNMLGAGSRAWHAFCYESQAACSTDVRKIAYDPAKAKALLAEAGYPNGFEMDIYGFRTRPRIEAMMGYLSAVGIKTKLQFLQYAAIREKQGSGEAQLVDTSWGSYSVNDTSAIVNPFFTHNKDDMVHDAEIKALADTASIEIDVAKRKEIYAKILNRIADNVFVLPLATSPAVYAFTKDLQFKAYADENPRFYLSKWK